MLKTILISCTEIQDNELRVLGVHTADIISQYTNAAYHFIPKPNTKTYFSLENYISYCNNSTLSITSLLQTRNKTTNLHFQTTQPHDQEANNGN